MTRYSTYYYSRDDANEERQTMYIIGAFLLGLLGFVAYLIFFDYPEEYRLKSLQVKPATIVQMDNSEGPWVRVEVPGIATSEELWVEVSDDFYNQHNVFQHVGVLIGQYDKYQVRREEGKIMQRYQEETWGVTEVYDSLEIAQKANPLKKFTMPAKVTNLVSEQGRSYLILEVQGKKAKVLVDREAYRRLKVGASVEARFESIGEFTKFQGI